ncbi:hypothetical protein [Aphanothece sacrum]|uniref:Uncharacterized protein n=1 Tax=Aphanothece sacrum FPU1 TaxID=1920663 RepID=A0A401IEK9_APHSA|nr:hypothetical protein [Aphanothece sacrum]GBF79708.1 hypothetical protein AsFPU1_1107 [Aphanothece sacrum FPU1]GBF82127.1 hypothetical protein AsFPU1_3554 [Aphanothece sacrum FPU1]GBF86420.1 hypothetical protein AsFPU3_3491 [Aphanothece sacrum FPU3]GBF87170.1 hypothetical protein AsFPU3_4252 [Aphanothece sacrum FPU3]
MLIEKDGYSLKKGFRSLIETIAYNNVFEDDDLCYGHKVLTHKEVRIIAKSAIANNMSHCFYGDIDNQIMFYLWSLQCYGLTHKERISIARQILDLIKEQETREEIEKENDTIEGF